MNNAGMGLLGGDYSRAIGFKPVSDASYTKLALAAAHDQAIADREKGLAYNLLATDNPSSALSRLIDRTPNSPQTAMATMLSSLFNFRQVFGTNLLAAISPARAGADEFANPNKFQRYGFTDAEIGSYKPEAVVHYFEDTIATKAGLTSRVEIMGDPSTFAMGSEDANTNDALHCFVNRFTNPYAEGAKTDPVCLDIGYLTQTAGIKPATEAQYAAGIDGGVYGAWCAKNKLDPCPITAAPDEMLRYRLYLAYQNTAEELYSTSLSEAESVAEGYALSSPNNGSGAITAPVGPTPTAPGAPITGTAKDMAKQIITLAVANKITFQQSADRQDVVNTANGTPIASCGLNAGLDPAMLKLILTASQKYTFSINALVSGHNCLGGQHPKGKAVDFGNVNGLNATSLTLTFSSYKAFATYVGAAIPSGGGVGQLQALGKLSLPAGVMQFEDSLDHVHMQVP